ncbi:MULTISPECIES: flagellar hook-basal body complex protein FliE [unclassified Methylophilus]|jgi:flagellar hook-basal body complex protein FliE|uniref:Flagellar hook-basal body complex protein FliE n=1 Tax=Methylophilus glucosoxydans TaxID=752553 RepID=A0ABW3GPS3_9PROT|nr:MULTISPECIES: flagellar hook-basal body complex protein FliE [unclassified Methylophilus]MBF5038156.1 flagellar hook-basal body complex protein FliE [Methylophilus sp. 13]MDF0376654.1 flagellar hook-basal body complex protein FliE [Methylophilus sp. YYY-1]MDT7850552.1 flagellar hook-basal body complex protein FliE [Methylophilus sp. VKM B-3414]BEV07877.1 flagellar hook-basal body complex protein FliE [Methylophilus sp. DW102]
MNAGGIDAQRISSMLAQLRAAAQKPEGLGNSAIANPVAKPPQASPTTQVSFSDALKSSLDQVNNMQLQAEQMGKDFAMGNDNVSLSDVMISGQKANIAFQATVQVRNKLVTAYQDMMNMQV